MKLLLVAAIPLFVVATTERAEACKSSIDHAYRAIHQIINYPPDGNASDWRFAIQDLNQDTENARTCIAKQPAGPKRTALEAEYKKLQQKVSDVNVYITSYGELRDLDQELVALRKKLGGAADVEAEAVAAQQRIAALTNHYATAAWRKRHHDAFEALRTRQRTARAAAAATAELERLAANTVVARHAGRFKPEDSFDPDKIAEAFEAATPADLVVTRHRATYAPSPTKTQYRSSIHARRFRDGDEDLYTGISDTYVRIDVVEERIRPLPEGVPALVWEASSAGDAVIVTMDGGRYRASVDGVEGKLSASTAWPTQPIHTHVFQFDIEELGKLGVVDAKTAKAMAAANGAYHTCASKLWKAHDPAFDRIAASNITESTKRARVEQLNTAVSNKIEAQCRRHAVAFDKAWRPIAKSYAAGRAKVLARTRAHLAKLAPQ